MGHTLETKIKISKSRMGIVPWNKGIKGLKRAKRPNSVPHGEENKSWKGEGVGYRGLHIWVEKHLGKPHFCQNCGDTSLNHRQYHWANISKTYKRNLADWKRLCVSCHKRFDKLSINNTK